MHRGKERRNAIATSPNEIQNTSVVQGLRSRADISYRPLTLAPVESEKRINGSLRGEDNGALRASPL